MSISHGKTLDEMSLNKFISSACGVSFSADICAKNLNYFTVERNLALFSHFGNCFSTINQKITASIGIKHLILNGLDALQTDTAFKSIEKLEKLFRPPLSKQHLFSSSKSVSSELDVTMLSITAKIYQKYSSSGMRVKAPNINEFPGDFLTEPTTTNGIVVIKSKFNEFHCTGYYIAAGSSIKVSVLEGSPTGWEIRISCHTDDLSSLQSLKRWPLVHTKTKLKKLMNLTSAFGGIIYLDSPNGNSTLKIKLENVIETPFFELTRRDKNWDEITKAAGLWAELCGKHIVFTVPSNSIRNLTEKELDECLKVWDLIIIANHELRGTSLSNSSRERVVIDVQPFNDKIHSGYPVTLSYGMYIIRELRKIKLI